MIDFALEVGSGLGSGDRVRTLTVRRADRSVQDVPGNLAVFPNIFPWQAWILVAAEIALAVALLPRTTRNKRGCNFDQIWKEVMEQKHEEETLSYRLASLTLWTFIYFLHAYYTSDLTALMTAAKPPKPVSSLQEAWDKGYTIMALGGSSTEEYLARSANDLYDKMQQDRAKHFLRTWAEARQRLSEDPMAAFLGSSSPFAGNKDNLESLMQLKEAEKMRTAFALPRDSELG